MMSAPSYHKNVIALLASLTLACGPLHTANRAMKAGQYADAIHTYQGILSHRSAKRAQSGLAKAKVLESKRLTMLATKALEEHAYSQAFELLSKALALDAKNDEALSALNRSRDGLLEQADGLLSRSQPQVALELYTLVLTEYLRSERAIEGQKVARMQVAQTFSAQAQKRSTQNPTGALIAFLKAAEHGDTEALNQAEALADALLKSHQLSASFSLNSRRHPGIPRVQWQQEITRYVQASKWPITKEPAARAQKKLSITIEVGAPQTEKVIEASTRVLHPQGNKPSPIEAEKSPEKLQWQSLSKARAEAEKKWQEDRTKMMQNPGYSRLIQNERDSRQAFNSSRVAESKARQAYENSKIQRKETSAPTQYEVLEGWVQSQFTVSGICQIDTHVPFQMPINFDAKYRVEDTAHDTLALENNRLELPSKKEVQQQAIANALNLLKSQVDTCYEQWIGSIWQTADEQVAADWQSAATENLMEAYLLSGQRSEDVQGYFIEVLGAPEPLLKALWQKKFTGLNQERK